MLNVDFFFQSLVKNLGVRPDTVAIIIVLLTLELIVLIVGEDKPKSGRRRSNLQDPPDIYLLPSTPRLCYRCKFFVRNTNENIYRGYCVIEDIYISTGHQCPEFEERDR